MSLNIFQSQDLAQHSVAAEGSCAPLAFHVAPPPVSCVVSAHRVRIKGHVAKRPTDDGQYVVPR